MNTDNADLKTIAFDWGNTLMKELPQYSGRMADWPEVQEIDGLQEILPELSKRYQLIVASNAVDSDAEAVSRALERVGLKKYFSAVFTTHEIQQNKPDIEYFRQIEHAIGKTSQQILMIGDHFRNDILGAFQAGWRSLWYNPQVTPCPGLTPLHNGEIYHMLDLKNDVSSLLSPSWPTCQVWQRTYEVSYTLCEHMQAVASVAYLLGTWMQKRGLPVNTVQVHRAGLLHDMAKLIEDRESGLGHARLAADFLINHQQPELAEIVYRHPLFAIEDQDRKPATWEQKLVYLADKLVEHGEIVSVEIRMQALRERYGFDSPIPSALLELQQEVYQAVGFSDAQEFTARIAESLAGA
jgi:beta-phosphoglucomutase-like phosphatase (HAD superfamily)